MSSNPAVSSATGLRVTTGSRILARLINTGIIALPGILISGIGVFTGSAVLKVMGLVLCVALWLANAAVLVSRSQSLGSILMRFHYAHATDGRPARWLALWRHLLSDLLAGVTFGIAHIVMILTHSEGQHYVDRWFEVVALHPAPRRAREMQVPVNPPVQAAPQAHAPVSPPAPEQPPPAVPPPPPPGALPAPGPSPRADQIIEASPFAPSPAVPGAEPPRPAPAISPVRARPPQHVVADSALDDETVTGARVGEPGTRIRLDDGQIVTLTTPVVFGRSPVVPAGFEGAQARSLTDESMRMSKTHAIVLAQEGRVQVLDPGARNGVVFEVGGTRSRIAPDSATVVPDGAVVYLGGRSFRVLS